MTNKELAELMFPNLEHDVNYYENLYPERNLPEGAVVSRFAPSPTGFVHMGSLLAAFIEKKVPKDTNGVFFLRIEDTDGKRSVENGVQGIIDDLKNFDIDIDEDEEFEGDTATIGGWVVSMLEGEPQENDSVTFENLLITVKKADGIRIERIAVEELPIDDEEAEED